MAMFERAAAGLPEPEERITVTDAIKHFIEYKESRGYKHKSVDKLKLGFESRFRDFCDDRELPSIGRPCQRSLRPHELALLPLKLKRAWARQARCDLRAGKVGMECCMRALNKSAVSWHFGTAEAQSEVLGGRFICRKVH